MRIESDGTTNGTRVYTDNGEEIKGIVGLVINFSAERSFGIAHMEVLMDYCNIKIDDYRIRIVTEDDDGLIKVMQE